MRVAPRIRAETTYQCAAYVREDTYGQHGMRCERRTGDPSGLCFQHRKSHAQQIDEVASAHGWTRLGHNHHRFARYTKGLVTLVVQYSANQPSQVSSASDSTGWVLSTRTRNKLSHVKERLGT